MNTLISPEQLLQSREEAVTERLEFAVGLCMKSLNQAITERWRAGMRCLPIAFHRIGNEDPSKLAARLVEEINATETWRVVGEPITISFWDYDQKATKIDFESAQKRPLNSESIYFALRVAPVAA